MSDRRLISAKGFWQLVLGAMIVALVVGVYTDVSRVVGTLTTFEWHFLALALLLTLGNQTLRFAKWEYLLRELSIDVPLRSSLVIFGSALIMIMSPGKVGEAWKSWLLRDRHGTAVPTSLPVVAVERLTDLLGVGVLTIVGAYAFSRSLLGVVVLLSLVAAGVAVLRSRRFCEWWFDRLERVPVAAVSERVTHLRDLYDASYRLLTVRVLGVTTGLSVLSWGLECLGLWLIVRGFGIDLSVLTATFAFAFSSIVGALSLLPGGVGATEGSMAILLVESGMPREFAVGATLLARLATLWFSAGLSVLVLAGRWFVSTSDGPV